MSDSNKVEKEKFRKEFNEMKLNKQTSIYFMPKCYACDRRYKVFKKECMRISFLTKDETGYHRDTRYSQTGSELCTECYAEFKRIGPLAFLKKMSG